VEVIHGSVDIEKNVFTACIFDAVAGPVKILRGCIAKKYECGIFARGGAPQTLSFSGEKPKSRSAHLN
jgi:hypothetical protein